MASPLYHGTGSDYHGENSCAELQYLSLGLYPGRTRFLELGGSYLEVPRLQKFGDHPDG